MITLDKAFNPEGGWKCNIENLAKQVKPFRWLGVGCMRLPVVDGKPEKIDSTKNDEC
jgi:hypothetical protein